MEARYLAVWAVVYRAMLVSTRRRWKYIMEPKELQVGESYVLPANAKLVVKPMGAQRPFVMLFHDASDIIDAAIIGDTPARRRNTQSAKLAIRLCMWIIGHMRHMQGNRVLIDVEHLAEHFHVNTRSVYRALATLCTGNIIRKQTPKGWYAVNPRVAWSGQTGTKYGEALTVWDSGLVGPYMQADGENDAVMNDAKRDAL